MWTERRGKRASKTIKHSQKCGRNVEGKEQLEEALSLVEDCSFRNNDRINSLESEKNELEIEVSNLVALSKSLQEEEIKNLEKEKEREEEKNPRSANKDDDLKNSEKKKGEEETTISLTEAKSVIKKISIEKKDLEGLKFVPSVRHEEQLKKARSVEVRQLEMEKKKERKPRTWRTSLSPILV